MLALGFLWSQWREQSISRRWLRYFTAFVLGRDGCTSSSRTAAGSQGNPGSPSCKQQPLCLFPNTFKECSCTYCNYSHSIHKEIDGRRSISSWRKTGVQRRHFCFRLYLCLEELLRIKYYCWRVNTDRNRKHTSWIKSKTFSSSYFLIASPEQENISYFYPTWSWIQHSATALETAAQF